MKRFLRQQKLKSSKLYDSQDDKLKSLVDKLQSDEALNVVTENIAHAEVLN